MKAEIIEQQKYSEIEAGMAKPFLKWAGGKSQLIPQLRNYLPLELKSGQVTTYIEPFVGGGAVFFYIMQNYNMEKAFIIDINPELILAYKVIQEEPYKLIEVLEHLSKRYLKSTNDQKEKMFYEIRKEYNHNLSIINQINSSKTWINRAAQMIFLNKTCFNGLFRVNKQGEFNVPFGGYKNPKILDEDNFVLVHDLLSNTTILLGDYQDCEQFIDSQSFIYFDPPYRPISETAAFTSYTKSDFDDQKQRELAQFYRLLDTKYKCKMMLSNSDPKNNNPDDDFFEEIYSDYRIIKLHANRMINCVAEKRGKITELLILNY